jgi:hypothetical protein
MKVTYPPGTICVRCGGVKKDKAPGCKVWGRYYSRHMWNMKKLRIEVHTLKI